MAKKTKIAVDLSGSNLDVKELIKICKKIVEEDQDVELGLFAEENQIKDLSHKNINLHFCDLVLDNQASVIDALRNYRSSTMGLAIKSVKNGEYDAIVSSGNTAFLVAMSVFILGRIKGIQKPAIFSPFPTRDKLPLYMLDVGANSECSAKDLLDFAVMGKIAIEKLGVDNPKIALLNIGTESHKGNQVIQKANFLLHQNLTDNYMGFVEPNCLHQRPCDLLVSDGFSGNLVIKSAEGTASFVLNEFKNFINKSFFNKAIFYPFVSSMKKYFKKLQPDHHNGAILLGLNGTVIKSHGSATADGFYYAVRKAINLSREDIVKFTKERLESLQKEKEEAI